LFSRKKHALREISLSPRSSSSGEVACLRMPIRSRIVSDESRVSLCSHSYTRATRSTASFLQAPSACAGLTMRHAVASALHSSRRFVFLFSMPSHVGFHILSPPQVARVPSPPFSLSVLLGVWQFVFVFHSSRCPACHVSRRLTVGLLFPWLRATNRAATSTAIRAGLFAAIGALEATLDLSCSQCIEQTGWRLQRAVRRVARAPTQPRWPLISASRTMQPKRRREQEWTKSQSRRKQGLAQQWTWLTRQQRTMRRVQQGSMPQAYIECLRVHFFRHIVIQPKTRARAR